MNILEFSGFLKQLEETSKRLEITSILASLIKKGDLEETRFVINLALGRLKAPFENPNFSIADKMMIRAIEQATGDSGKVLEMYGKLGDLGDVIFQLKEKMNIPTKNSLAKPLTISEIFQKLCEIAELGGTGSQEQKVSGTSELLVSLDSLSAKYITRIILGTTRLGFTELTIIAALSEFLDATKSKTLTAAIEDKYNNYPDIGLIVYLVKKSGIEGLAEIKMTIGVPIEVQKASRVSGIEEAFERIPDAWTEFKLDGTRVQLHMRRNNTQNTVTVNTYTRNMEDSTHQFPDLARAVERFIKADSIIFDGEAIGYDVVNDVYLPFQETIQRKRKHNVEEFVNKIPLKYIVFDILYLNGEPVYQLPLTKRHEILESVIEKNDTILFVKPVICKSLEQLQEQFEEAKEKNLEGLIVKNPKDSYQAGARSYSWIKLKKADKQMLEDSIDGVILGYYFGKGTRSKFGIGKFLLGIYDKEADEFKTLTKVGTGLTDLEWHEIKAACDKYKLPECPNNVVVPSTLKPDIWLTPQIVVEVGGDELTVSSVHSSGYGLRFPRLIKFRYDKKALSSTNLDEIKDLFYKRKS